MVWEVIDASKFKSKEMGPSQYLHTTTPRERYLPT